MLCCMTLWMLLSSQPTITTVEMHDAICEGERTTARVYAVVDPVSGPAPEADAMVRGQVLPDNHGGVDDTDKSKCPPPDCGSGKAGCGATRARTFV